MVFKKRKRKEKSAKVDEKRPNWLENLEIKAMSGCMILDFDAGWRHATAHIPCALRARDKECPNGVKLSLALPHRMLSRFVEC
jgi:hypothetical protein